MCLSSFSSIRGIAFFPSKPVQMITVGISQNIFSADGFDLHVGRLAAHAWHVEIEEHELVVVFFERFHRDLTVVGHLQLDVRDPDAKNVVKKVSYIGVVIDDEYGVLRARFSVRFSRRARCPIS